MSLWNDERIRRWGVTLVAGFLLLATQLAPLREVVYENVFFNSADAAAVESVDASFERALVAFALARVTNAAISFLQDTEVTITPLGVGVTLAVGEVLDPINDLVERFSWVMLLSLTALGVQKVLLEVGPWLGVEVLLAVALTLLLGGLWWRREWRYNPAWLGRRLLVLAILVRFCVPFAAYLNQETYTIFLDERYATASGEIESGSRELSAIQKKMLVTARSSDTQGGSLEQAKRLYTQTAESFSLRGKIDQLKEKATRMLNNFLSLTVVFLLNTVIFPLAFLWGGIRLGRLLLEPAAHLPVDRILGKRYDADAEKKVHS